MASEDQIQQASLVTGPEKSRALDTASILGGNEVLVAQLLKDQEGRVYSEDDKSVIQWALGFLWKDPQRIDSQAIFNDMLTPSVRQTFPKLVSNCLLYCVRHEDTQIWTHPTETNYRALIINTMNIPYTSLPLAMIHDKKTPCTKLAMIYTKPSDDQTASTQRTSTSDSRFLLQRKLSQSVFYERSLLHKINMIAVIPVP